MLSGCVSAGIFMVGKKYVPANSREEAIEAYGDPIIDRNVSEKEKLNYHQVGIPSTTSHFEIYTYHGLMENTEAAAAASTVNAISLGFAEPLMIGEALEHLSKDHRRYYFVAFYNKGDELILFRRVKQSEYRIVNALKKEGCVQGLDDEQNK